MCAGFSLWNHTAVVLIVSTGRLDMWQWITCSRIIRFCSLHKQNSVIFDVVY